MNENGLFGEPAWLRKTWLITSIVVCIAALGVFLKVDTVGPYLVAAVVLFISTSFNVATMGTAGTLQKEARRFNRPGDMRTVIVTRILVGMHLAVLIVSVAHKPW